MEKIIISPGKYVQKEHAIKDIASYVQPLGDTPLFISDNFVLGLVQTDIEASYETVDTTIYFENFNGEASKNEIARISADVKEKGINCIVGVGGGKTLDTAKAVAFYAKLPVVIVPTVASTDAPTSALSVLYTDEGVFDEYLMLPSSPNLVLMDLNIIANAPVRLLIAGMGDALATFFEARACVKTTMAGGYATNAAKALARLNYDVLLRKGVEAKLAVEANVVTPAVEDIVEANTYLSGIGFESCGLAAAHAVHNGMTVIEELHHLYHGEKVAFGVITQLVLENAPSEEINEVLGFCKALGLPTCFAELGAADVPVEKWMGVAELACSDGETIHNMVNTITPEMVYSAIIGADKLGAAFKA